MIVSEILINMWNKAMEENKKNIIKLCEPKENCNFLDLGCDEGSWSLKLATHINAKKIYGIDMIDERLSIAKKKGIVCKKSDLNNPFPFMDCSFDAVHANQVIEHISDCDNFISEIYRVLKKGGYFIVSTENASSWCNIFASIFGFQIFSLTNVSKKKLGIGNPFAIHRGKTIDLSSWTHKTVFNYFGLKELFKVHGFKNLVIKGAGYFPLPASLGNIDPLHSHFMTIKGYKI